MASATERRVNEVHGDIKLIKEFVTAIKLAGGDVPSGLNIALATVDRSQDIWAACGQVQAEVQFIYQKNSEDCALSGGGPDLDGLCAANNLHYYNWMALKKTFSWKDDHAVPQVVWKLWKPKIAAWLIEQATKRPVNVR